jgi:tellurite resistance protein TerB
MGGAYIKYLRTLSIHGEAVMALDWLVGKYEEVSKGLKTEVTKIKNKQFLEAVLAGVVAVSYADGTVSSEEKNKMMGFLRSNDVLSVFDSAKVIELFNKYMSKYEFDTSIGEMEALAVVAKIKPKEAEARLLVRVCCAIGAADGDFDDSEKAVVRKICSELGLNPAEFDLA